MEKSFKKHTKTLSIHQILKQYPKTVKIEQKNDFEPLDQPLVKKSTKDILSGEWMN